MHDAGSTHVHDQNDRDRNVPDPNDRDQNDRDRNVPDPNDRDQNDLDPGSTHVQSKVMFPATLVEGLKPS